MAAENTIQFSFDRTKAIVVAHPSWTIRTEADCVAWFGQYERYFAGLGRGVVDVVFVLDDFKVEREIATVWGEYRAKMVKTFTRHSVRVHPSLRVSTISHTSGVIHSAASEEAPSLDEAFAIIEKKRKAEKGV